jgi:hypothetical protein
MRGNITEPKHPFIPPNVESEAKPLAVVMSWGREARRQKRALGGGTAPRDLLGGLQNVEKEEEFSYIEKTESLAVGRARHL